MRSHDIDLLGPLPHYLGPAADGMTVESAPNGNSAWLVRDYALGRQVFTNPSFSRSEAVKPHVPQLNDAQPVKNSIMSLDGEEHARLRRIVAGIFTTRQAASMAPFIERLTDEHIDRMAVSGAPADLITGIAYPVPLAVICQLLGIPLEDSAKFKDLVEVLFDISASSPDEKSHRRLELANYMAHLIQYKRKSPGHDVLSGLISAHNRGEMSKGEMLTMGLALLMAGYETTVGQIGLMMLSLLSDPDIYARLHGRPELIPFAVEESLRLNPSVPLSFARVALEPVPLGSFTVEAGESIVVSLMHGNRDEKVFPEPNRLSVEDRAPAHLTFGHGTHRCLGAPLARLQMQIILSRFVRRFPSLQLAEVPEPISWKDGLVTRGLSSLIVSWQACRDVQLRQGRS
jgi:cytochrome P450